jgi:hypothetical protein
MNSPQFDIESQGVVGSEFFPQADQWKDIELSLVPKELGHN